MLVKGRQQSTRASRRRASGGGSWKRDKAPGTAPGRRGVLGRRVEVADGGLVPVPKKPGENRSLGMTLLV